MTNKPELLTGERLPREGYKAILACNGYLRLGPGRSLAKLLNRYQAGAETPPTKRLNTLKAWSSQFDWQLRAAAYDAEIERQKTAYVQEIMKTGLATAHERVLKLKMLADFLEQQLYAQDVDGPPAEETEGQVTRRPPNQGQYPNIWLADVKQIGAGEFSERVDIVRFNASLIEEFRGTLDDLARETGGRRQKRDNFNIDLSQLSDDQLQRIAAGEDLLDVILSNTG